MRKTIRALMSRLVVSDPAGDPWLCATARRRWGARRHGRLVAVPPRRSWSRGRLGPVTSGPGTPQVEVYLLHPV
ncbi:hypothetical protein [Streptosporangium sp. NPDC000509]|uniref:hypothetical protein n=1 Tax=Streptosporangium sp. NPDC000509 TaxID=3366186 RepID=UPI0036BD0251